MAGEGRGSIASLSATMLEISESATGHGTTVSVRKFVPQLEETSTRSCRKAKPIEETQQPPAAVAAGAGDVSKSRRRFAPQLEETSVRSNRSKPTKSPPSTSQPLATHSTIDQKLPRARFAPQLIETAKRSRRKGDGGPGHTDSTDFSPGDRLHTARHSMPAGRHASYSQETAIGHTDEAPQSRFSYANLCKARRSTMQKPTLECIPSSESDESQVPSLSHSPSAKSDEFDVHKHATRIRESCDERFAGYLLAQAAQLAEKQLREQAMAAYPNESLHEPVDHFARNRGHDDSGSEEGFGLLSPIASSSNIAGTARRESAAGWDASEMQRHREALEEQRKQHVEQGHKLVSHQPELLDSAAYGRSIKDPGELRQMREAARPPLLGGSLVFPSCPSPRQTRIDAYQRPDKQRHRHDHHHYNEHASNSQKSSGLWGTCTPSSTLSRKDTSASTAGLWGGFCDVTMHGPPGLAPNRLLQAGLLTPGMSTPTEDVFDAMHPHCSTHVHQPSPLSPFMNASKPCHDNTTSMLGNNNLCTNRQQLPAAPSLLSSTAIFKMDRALAREAALDAEFPDSFVTQVYNYLSLGYPALARKYDDELSKISKLSLADIRRADDSCDAKGHVDVPERSGSAMQGSVTSEIAANVPTRTQSDDDAHPETCGRWRALRLYVREWGRQEGRMQEIDQRPGAQAVRRGSWLS